MYAALMLGLKVWFAMEVWRIGKDWWGIFTGPALPEPDPDAYRRGPSDEWFNQPYDSRREYKG